MIWLMDEDLFPDGWREPSDDCERMAYYIVYAFTGLICTAGVVIGLIGLMTIWAPHPLGSAWGLLCLPLLIPVLVFFCREIKHWDMKHLSAERFVASGFCFGFGLMIVGAMLLRGGPGRSVHVSSGHDYGALLKAFLIFEGLGFADLVLFLFIGLFIAYLPKMRLPRRFPCVCVERRYALDDKGNEIENPACPFEDHLLPFIRLRCSDGRRFLVRPTLTSYDLAEPGHLGEAVVRGSVLEAFRANREITRRQPRA